MNRETVVPDLRHQVRKRFRSRVSVFWEDGSGDAAFCWGYSVDVSETGAQLQLTASVPRGSYVDVRLEDLNFTAFGVVRHSNSRCVIGVELRPETAEPEQFSRWQAFTGASQH